MPTASFMSMKPGLTRAMTIPTAIATLVNDLKRSNLVNEAIASVGLPGDGSSSYLPR